MSWASARETTRIEDMAYCLLGIFSVSMPLLYGERERAFIRLQEEIIKVTDDQTIFAWRDPIANDASTKKGLLAENPRCFAQSAHYIPCRDEESSEPHSMSNGRVKVELRFITDLGEDRTPFGQLSCIDEREPKRLIVINLELTSNARQEYHRILCHELWADDHLGSLKSIFVPQNATSLDLRPLVYRPPNISIFLRNLAQPGGIENTANLHSFAAPPHTRSLQYWVGQGFGQSLFTNARRWVPTPIPVFFAAPSVAATPVAALNFSFSDTRITILLGTTSTMEIGCCALENPVSKQWHEISESFVPSTLPLLLVFRAATNSFQLTLRDVPRSFFKLSWSATSYEGVGLTKPPCYIVDFAFKRTTLRSIPVEQDTTAIKKSIGAAQLLRE